MSDIMGDLRIQTKNGSTIFTVKVVPGSSRNALGEVLDGMLKIKITAAPERGKANKALIEFLAKSLTVARKDVDIISGHTSPIKQVQVNSLGDTEITDRLNL